MFKSDQTKHGPEPCINGTNRNVIARTAMYMKEQDEEEVTYSSIIAHNPKASLNPNTGKPVSKKVLYNLLKRHCYDDCNNPEDKWIHDYRFSKKALTEKQIEARYNWAWQLEGNILNPQWCWQNLIWTDICNTILATTKHMHQKQARARKAKKGWGSKKTKKKYSFGIIIRLAVS